MAVDMINHYALTELIWGNKYKNIETGKYNSDKLHSIKTSSLVHLIDNCEDYRHGKFDTIHNDNELYNIVKIEMKEERRLQRIEKEKEEKIRRMQRREEKKREREIYNKNIRQLQKERQDNHNNTDYLKTLQEERERIKINEEHEETPLIYLNGLQAGQRVCNIRPNKWFVK